VKLDGARCLVVGGARRLGAVIALDLAAHGADLAVSTRSAAGDAAETCAAIRRLGRRGVAVTGDAAAAPGAAGLVAAAAEALGGLDVLVYAASGPFRPAAPQNIDPRDWQTSFDVVVRGFFVAACAARGRFVGNAAHARDGEGAGPVAAPPAAGQAVATRGVIVALTDVLGAAPSAAFAGHGAAKAAQIMLVASLAKAWASDGVRVCGVAPGPIDLPDDPRRAATLRAAARSATGRPVAPDDIARAVRFMIACDALTGVNLPVDGGALLGGATL
jgi:NAD(P)-dependent dehydrogenase (short-subunit alcohol dehydrogenase family)